MKQKMYETNKTKKDKSTIVIKTDLLSIPNKLHLDAQIRFPARIQEDKRFKKPKHKNKDIDW